MSTGVAWPQIEYGRVTGLQPKSGGVSMLFDDGDCMRAIFLAQNSGLHDAAAALRVGERISLHHDPDGAPVEIPENGPDSGRFRRGKFPAYRGHDDLLPALCGQDMA